jgi:methionyl-tRNA synthetase
MQDNIWVFLFIIAWSLLWKGLALWRSAQKNENIWFVAILLVNTLGLLELFYLYILPMFRNKNTEENIS